MDGETAAMNGEGMLRRAFRFAMPFFAVFAAGCAGPATAPLYRWTQLGPEATVSLRAVVPGDAACPKVRVAGRELALDRRAEAGGREGGGRERGANPAFDPPFAVASCELALPAATPGDALGGWPVPLPRAPVRRIVVVGDTGCRIKVPASGPADPVQDCADPAAWPWARLATTAAALQPDLVIHVGDYHYREYCDDPARCGGKVGGSVAGYGWAGWEADFFAPGAPLLAAAPWVVVRGNHEDCDRAGEGWMRLLSPLPYRPCGDQRYRGASRSVLGNNLTEPAYRIDIDDGLGLVVIDNAGYDDARPAATAAADEALFGEALVALARPAAGRSLWLLSHRPLWYDLLAPATQPNAQQRALQRAAPAELRYILAGHVHAFATLNFARDADPGYPGGRPAQAIVGGSGTQLDALDPWSPYYEGADGAGSRERRHPGGRLYQGVAAASGLLINRYSFLLLDRRDDGHGWSGALLDPDGGVITRCRLHDDRKEIACDPPVAARPAH